MKKRKSEGEESLNGGRIPNRKGGNREGETFEAELATGQVLHFTGTAQLTVQSGAVWISGRVVTPDTGAVSICADARVGGPLAIEASNAGVQVPCAGGGSIAFSLRSNQPQPADASDTDAQPSFQAMPRSAAAPGVLPPPDYSPEWRQAAAQLAVAQVAAPCIAVVGSKQAGKSSFARLAVNTLLNTWPLVAYLDADCGQAEFTAPGLVALTILTQPVTGPPHMHPLQPAQAHFIGDTSPQVNPTLYVRSIASLLDWFRGHTAEQQGSGAWQVVPPLVINTHGWIKGTGLDMLVQVLAVARVSHLVQLQTLQPKRNLPSDASWASSGAPPAFAHLLLPAADVLAGGTLRPLQPPTGIASPGGEQSLKGGMSAVDTRALSWLAFARGCLDARHCADSKPAAWDSASFAAAATALARQPPFVTSWRALRVQVMHCAVPHAQLPVAINGTVVGLAVCGPEAPGSRSGEERYRHVLNDDGAAPLPCAGLGIVRSLDVEAGLLYLLTSLADAKLQAVNTLQVGRLQLPPGLLQAPGLQSPYLALFSLTSDAGGSRSMKSRGNLLRTMHL